MGANFQGAAEEEAVLVERPAVPRWHEAVMDRPRGQVDVLGERQRRQADGDGAGAGGVHVSVRGFLGELAVDQERPGWADRPEPAETMGRCSSADSSATNVSRRR